MPSYGDASLFYDNPTAKRELYANKKGLQWTVFPGDVELKDDPNYAFKPAWVDKNDLQMIDDYRDEGYDFVTEDRFSAKRWRWDAGKLAYGNSWILMHKPFLEAEAAAREQRATVQNRIDGATDSFHAQADSIGVESFERKHGNTVVGAKGRK